MGDSEDEDTNQALCVYSRKVQPAISRASGSARSPARHKQCRTPPTLLILSTALPENLEVSRPAHHRTSTNLWTAANPEVSD